MAIPDTPEWERFLSSISLDPKGSLDPSTSFDVIGPKGHTDGRRHSMTPPVSAYYSSGDMTFDAAKVKIQKELRNAGHVANDDMVRLVLGMAAMGRPITESATRYLNNLIRAICDSDLSVFVIGAFEDPNSSRREIGEFRVGPVDRDLLKYRCEKVGCDFFHRYPDSFIGLFGIERKPFKVRLIDFSFLPDLEADVDLHLHLDIQDEYFGIILLDRFDVVAAEFDEETLVVSAMGAPIIDLRQVLSLDGSLVGIFQNIGVKKQGHFRPLQQWSVIKFRPSQDKISKLRTKIREEHSFSAFDDSKIHSSIKTFLKLVVVARKHRANDDTQIAFLHCVIALETIFADSKNGITNSLARRLAVVAAGPLDKPFGELVKHVAALYDSRSKYVHEGQKVPAEHIDAVWPLIEAAMESLFRLQKLCGERSTYSIDRWLKKLDIFANCLELGEPPPDAEFLRNGLAPPPGP